MREVEKPLDHLDAIRVAEVADRRASSTPGRAPGNPGTRTIRPAAWVSCGCATYHRLPAGASSELHAADQRSSSALSSPSPHTDGASSDALGEQRRLRRSHRRARAARPRAIRPDAARPGGSGGPPRRAAAPPARDTRAPTSRRRPRPLGARARDTRRDCSHRPGARARSSALASRVWPFASDASPWSTQALRGAARGVPLAGDLVEAQRLGPGREDRRARRRSPRAARSPAARSGPDAARAHRCRLSQRKNSPAVVVLAIGRAVGHPAAGQRRAGSCRRHRSWSAWCPPGSTRSDARGSR